MLRKRKTEINKTKQTSQKSVIHIFVMVSVKSRNDTSLDSFCLIILLRFRIGLTEKTLAEQKVIFFSSDAILPVHKTIFPRKNVHLVSAEHVY